MGIGTNITAYLLFRLCGKPNRVATLRDSAGRSGVSPLWACAVPPEELWHGVCFQGLLQEDLHDQCHPHADVGPRKGVAEVSDVCLREDVFSVLSASWQGQIFFVSSNAILKLWNVTEEGVYINSTPVHVFLRCSDNVTSKFFTKLFPSSFCVRKHQAFSLQMVSLNYHMYQVELIW